MKHLLSSIVLLMLSVCAVAQTDVEGSSDHPLFPTRVPGYYIGKYESTPFDVAIMRTKTGVEVEVSGKKTVIEYVRKENEKGASASFVALNYQAALKKLKPASERLENSWYWGQVKNAANEIWVQVSGWYGNGSTEETDSYMVTIVEKSLMEQVISAADISASIKATGHIALYILFDTGLATIKTESKPALEQIAAMLKKDPALKVYIVGHTDNQGNLESNMKLSLDRANAVVSELVTKYAVAANQMMPKGVASLSPVSTNDTEEGRKMNRRVELVKM
ncbi:MAG: OmpA family protein [Flammeovirgaceae bacterium]|jgi:OOP family OmpA-OmpF porin|nr:OmpA family protein [Flammeovirgaceae bacterium]MCZ8071354.1 OmpA family protein [Cytophagales bacterium]